MDKGKLLGKCGTDQTDLGELCETPSSCTQPGQGEIKECGMKPGIPKCWGCSRLGHHCSPLPLPRGCSQPCPSAFGTGMSLLQHQGLGGVFGEGLTPGLGVAGDGCQCSWAVTVSQQCFVPATTSDTPPGATELQPPSSSCLGCPLCPCGHGAALAPALQGRAGICASKSPEWH